MNCIVELKIKLIQSFKSHGTFFEIAATKYLNWVKKSSIITQCIYKFAGLGLEPAPLPRLDSLMLVMRYIATIRWFFV